jgi:hypothetical protein
MIIEWDEGVSKTVTIRYQKASVTKVRVPHPKEASQRGHVLRFVWEPPKHLPGPFTLQRMT